MADICRLRPKRCQNKTGRPKKTAPSLNIAKYLKMALFCQLGWLSLNFIADCKKVPAEEQKERIEHDH